MNREKLESKEIRVRFGKGKQVGEIVENLVFELNECSESIHMLEAIQAAWARLS